MSEFATNKPGSVFMNHKIAIDLLSQSNNYEALEEIKSAFELEKPDVIIDPQGLIEPIFNRLPALKLSYEKIDNDIWKKLNP